MGIITQKRHKHKKEKEEQMTAQQMGRGEDRQEQNKGSKKDLKMALKFIGKGKRLKKKSVPTGQGIDCWHLFK